MTRLTKQLLIAVFGGLPLLGVLGVAGIAGLVVAVEKLSPKRAFSEEEQAAILGVVDVNATLGLGLGGTPAVSMSTCKDVIGALPRCEHHERLGAVSAETTLVSDTRDRVQDKFVGAKFVAGGFYDIQAPAPWLGQQHLWMTAADPPVTELWAFDAERYATWRIRGVTVTDPAVLEALLADEVAAFAALPW